MKKYTITQTAPALQIWTYEVIANSEEEAIEMVEQGDAECVNYEVDGEPFDGGDIVVEGVEELKNNN